MATQDITTQDLGHVMHVADELAALADTLSRAIDGGVPPGDDAPEKVAEMILDRAVTVRDAIRADLQRQANTRAKSVTAAGQTDIVDTRAWQELYDARNMISVLRAALDAPDQEFIAFESQARLIGARIGDAMGHLETWANGWEKADGGAS